MNKYTDETYLYTEYKERKRSTYDIAEDCGVDPSTIQRWLDKFGISKRPNNKEKNGCFRHKKTGYAVFRDSSGEGSENRVYIHRLQAVAKEGFEAVKGKHVHHKNGIKWDNRFENLQVLNNSEHQTIHCPEGVNKKRKKSINSLPEI